MLGKFLALSLLGLALAAIPSVGHAQAVADRTAVDTGTNTTRTTRDDGFNLGWLGLLGLAGLAGLMPKRTHTVATHRAGDGTVR